MRPRSNVGAFFLYNTTMESKDLNIIINKKITDIWRGYGFYIHFSFGKIRTEGCFVEIDKKTYERDIPEISFCIEDFWRFVKNGKEIVSTDSEKDIQKKI